LIEFTLPGKYNTVIECCEKYISPRKYFLQPNRVGGNGWELSVSLDFSNGFCAKLKVDDESMATFIKLKLK
jgi:hypothetical protein